jgi:paraquat-inducible protein A
MLLFLYCNKQQEESKYYKVTLLKNHPSIHEPILCSGCDLLMTNVDPPPGHTVHCPRCGKRLHRYKTNSISKTLAISLTGLLLSLPANFMPLLTFDVLGINTSASLFTATLSMFRQGETAVGVMVFLCGFLFPLSILSLLFLVSLGLIRKRNSRTLRQLFRWYQHLREWAMTDVYLIGVFVTIIKMGHMADIEFNIGFFCFIGLVFATIGCQSTLDIRLFWSGLDPEPDTKIPAARRGATGAKAGLCLCHTCNKVQPLPTGRQPVCPRCGEHLHLRKKNSLTRTSALIFTAIIFTLPANMLPIMEVDYFGVPDRSTIMDGIIYFFKEGSYGIGAIILTASILVPLFKILGLILILLTIHFQLPVRLRQQAIMFRFIEFIGRWSMLDIFVISLLCALVRFGFFSTINVAPAALYFTGVVLATMFAAISFDPRLLWDKSAPPVNKKDSHATT